MSDQPVIKIDTTALAKTLEDRFKALEKTLEEKLTPQAKTTGVTEGKGPKTPQAFDYRPGVTNILKSFRERLGPDDYEKRRNIEDIAIRTETKKGPLKETNYSLKESFVETIGTVNPSCCIPEIWADKIERDHIYPGSIFLGAWFMNWYDEIQGKAGDTINICRVGPATCVDLSCDEPTTTAATVTCPQITLEHDACAYTICREDIEDVQVGLVDALNEGLGSCLAVCIDNYFFNVALSCANRGTYTATGRMTGSLIAEAMATMEAGNLCKWIINFNIAHTLMPIENRCRVTVNPRKQFVLIVVTNGKAPHVKVEHVALLVGSILFSTMKGIENISRNGEERNPNYSESDPIGRIYVYQTFMRNLENHAEIDATYAEPRMKDSSSTIQSMRSIHTTPFGLEITLRTLFYLVLTVTLLLIGQKRNWVYPTQSSRVGYPCLQTRTYEPAKLIMHPVPYKHLMQDSQFVNAATFGNRDVIATGRIVQYLGVEINETPKGTLVVGGGTYRSLLLAKGALAGAIKHGITVETEYSPRLQKRYVIADIRYGGVCLHPDGIYWILSKEY